MQSYDSMRGYFETTWPTASPTQKIPIRLSIHDISRPNEMAIAFSKCPASGINRLWWGRTLRPMSRRLRRASPTTVLCIVDLRQAKPEIVSKWWLPGMNRAAGEPDLPQRQARRPASHDHAVNRGYAAWRDGGFTIHESAIPQSPH